MSTTSTVPSMKNTGLDPAWGARCLALGLAFLPAAGWAQGIDLASMRSMVGGCLEAFPEMRPAYDAKSARLIERHRDVLPEGWTLATAPEAPFTGAALKQHGGEGLCEQAVVSLDQMSLRKVVGMPEKDVATPREEQLTRRLLAGEAPRVFLGLRYSLDAPPRVQAVIRSSPAQAAGIQVDDDIVSVAGRATPSGADVMHEILDAPAGRPLAIELRRAGQPVMVSVMPAPSKR